MRSIIPIFILVMMTAYGPLSMIEELEAKNIELAVKKTTMSMMFPIGESVTNGSMTRPNWTIGH